IEYCFFNAFFSFHFEGNNKKSATRWTTMSLRSNIIAFMFSGLISLSVLGSDGGAFQLLPNGLPSNVGSRQTAKCLIFLQFLFESHFSICGRLLLPAV